MVRQAEQSWRSQSLEPMSAQAMDFAMSSVMAGWGCDA